jgi:hypothetical protein
VVIAHGNVASRLCHTGAHVNTHCLWDAFGSSHLAFVGEAFDYSTSLQSVMMIVVV